MRPIIVCDGVIDLTPTAVAVKPRSVLVALILVTVALCVASVIGQYLRFFHGFDSSAGLIEDFNVEEEANFPTYFSSLLLLTAGSLLAIIARFQRFAGDPLSRRWTVLAAIFVFLSIDEAVGIHELAGQELPVSERFSGILYYAWVMPYGLAIALVGVYFVPFLRSLPNPHPRRFVASAMLYVVGALGVELAEAALASRTGHDTWPYQLVATLAELFEMVGISLFIWALLKFIESRGPTLRATVRVNDEG